MNKINTVEVCKILGIAKATIYNRKKAKTFPNPVDHVKAGRVYAPLWDESEIIEYKNNLAVKLDLATVIRINETGIKRAKQAEKLGVTTHVLNHFCNRHKITTLATRNDKRTRKVKIDPEAKLFSDFLNNPKRCLS